MSLSDRDAVSALRAEISFRRFHRETYAAVTKYMNCAYRERVSGFAELQHQHPTLAPFIELGAETGANALALVNELGLKGAACDISPDALAAMPAYARLLDAPELPTRIVLEAHNLPFRNGSIPFILAWGTLHHFKDPPRALRECRRVLHPDGLFYFDGEPVSRRYSLNLWTTPAYQFMGRLQRRLLEIGLLPYLAAIDGAEAIRAGVIERKYPLATWEAWMEVFDHVDWRFSPYITATIPSAGPATRWLANHVARRPVSDRTVVDRFGGALGGLCRRADDGPFPSPAVDLAQALACPDCLMIDARCDPDVCKDACIRACPRQALARSGGRLERSDRCTQCMACAHLCPLFAIDRPALTPWGDGYVCPECQTVFVRRHGMLFLLSGPTRRALSDLFDT